jgi:hypothetical protein
MTGPHAFALGIIVCLLAIVLLAEFENYREDKKGGWQ